MKEQVEWFIMSVAQDFMQFFLGRIQVLYLNTVCRRTDIHTPVDNFDNGKTLYGVSLCESLARTGFENHNISDEGNFPTTPPCLDHHSGTNR